MSSTALSTTSQVVSQVTNAVTSTAKSSGSPYRSEQRHSPLQQGPQSRARHIATQDTPQQPATQSASQPAKQLQPQPGTWTHPKLDEIVRRQNAAVFDKASVRRVAANALLLAFTWIVSIVCRAYLPTKFIRLVQPAIVYTALPLLGIRLFCVLNIIAAVRPLLAPAEALDDVALTPSQRALLGLQPDSAPVTPGQTFVTPPRYSRSVTPRSSGSRRATPHSPLTGSPLQRERRHSLDKSLLASQRGSLGTSQSNTSPWVQKALVESTARRLSFDGQKVNGALHDTSSPGNAKASVGLSSRWLYEKGRASPTSQPVFT